MINESTKNILKAMRCTAMATEFERQVMDHDTYGQLGFEERFALNVSWTRRRCCGLPLVNIIDEGHHIILSGASGSGKTYIACALGNAAPSPRLSVPDTN